MSAMHTVADLLAELARQVETYRQQAADHARQEAYHREQHQLARAALEKAEQRLTVLREATESLERFTPELDLTDYGSASQPKVARMVRKLVQARPAGVPFGPKAITDEINRAFEGQLRRPVDVRHVSIVLQRLSESKVIALVRVGRPHREAVYMRQGA